MAHSGPTPLQDSEENSHFHPNCDPGIVELHQISASLSQAPPG